MYCLVLRKKTQYDQAVSLRLRLRFLVCYNKLRYTVNAMSFRSRNTQMIRLQSNQAEMPFVNGLTTCVRHKYGANGRFIRSIVLTTYRVNDHDHLTL
jgi:hypothetical protein